VGGGRLLGAGLGVVDRVGGAIRLVAAVA